ncbi:MAG: transcriptional regulator [Bdellovibrionota bacterium]
MASSRPKDFTQVTRLQDILRTLAARRAGLTIEELVDLYQVTRRTVYRDLDALVQGGYPLYSAAGPDGRKLWRLHDRFTHVPPITLSMSELISLYLTKTQIGYLEGTPFAKDVANIFGQLEHTLSPKIREQLSFFERKFHFIADAPKSYEKKLDLLYDVMDALIRQRVCRMGYKPAGKRETTAHTIEPLTLLTHKQGLYLLARKRKEEKVLTFAVDRIVSFDLLGDVFDYPEDYSPRKQTEGAFGIVAGEGRYRVKIRFAPGLSSLVTERRFHPTQSVTQQRDGGTILEMTLSALSGELLSFVLSFGPDAKVLSPPELVQRVAQAHRQASAQYGKPV